MPYAMETIGLPCLETGFKHKKVVRKRHRLVAEAAVSVAESGQLIDAAVLPVLNELAVPLIWVGAVTVAAVGVAVGEAAVVAGELDAVGRLVPPELSALKGVRSVAVLDPVDKVVDNVVVSVRCSAVLAKHPRASTRDTTNTAVSHAGDTEVAEELVHLVVVNAKLVCDLEVVTLGVGT